MCNSKQFKLLKEQETRGLLSNMTGVKLPVLSDIPIANDLGLKIQNDWKSKKLLLTVGKFMPEMHLKQPGFLYSACCPFTKNKERTKKLKKQEIQDIFIKRIRENLFSTW